MAAYGHPLVNKYITFLKEETDKRGLCFPCIETRQLFFLRNLFAQSQPYGSCNVLSM